MAVFHNAADPPTTGNKSRAARGCTRNKSVDPMNAAATKTTTRPRVAGVLSRGVCSSSRDATALLTIFHPALHPPIRPKVQDDLSGRQRCCSVDISSNGQDGIWGVTFRM